MSQALYRKYRSKKLSEIVGQGHITRTLDNALKQGKISHAYLFTGPRGVGKTSIARILAHEINQLAYTDESMHLDIIEIDAASNRRIDEIRDLREKVHIAPTSAKYKVYIIDEVHMLTKEAFNALLKTLEEPPAHVIFILATTELHKLPDTIISRTQRFTFKPIEQEKAVEHMQMIAKSEKIDIEEDALKLLADHGRGSFRDSISLLDQVRNSGDKITKTDVERMIGLAATEHIEKLLEATLSGSPADIVSSLDQLTIDGVSPSQAAKQIASKIRQQIVSNNVNQAAITLLDELLGVSASPEPAGALEIALFKANLSLNQTPIASEVAKPAVVTAKPEAKPKVESIKPKPKIIDNESEPIPAVEMPESPVKAVAGEIADWWQDVLSHIKTINNTLYGVLRMAEPRVDEDTLHLSFGFGFHKKKATDPTTQSKIHEAIQQVTGKSYTINAVHDKNMTKSAQTEAVSEVPEPKTEQPSDISSITNIFGGGEVLES